MRALPGPKAAATSGAYTPVRRLRNWFRTAAVATTTSEPSGSSDDGPSMRRFPAGRPCARKAAHMAGSHETTALRPSCRAIQVAACCRTAAALVELAAAGTADVAPLPGDRNLVKPAAGSATSTTAAARAV